MRRISAVAALCLLSSCGGDAAPSSTGQTGTAAVAVVTAPVPASSPVPVDSTTLPANPGSTIVSFNGQDLVRRPSPYMVGVGTHFASLDNLNYDPTKSMAKLKELHATSFRDDIFWNAFAPSWDLQGTRLPAPLMDAAGRTTARPLLILNNGNPNIAGASPPLTDAGRSAFADFARRAAVATQSMNPIYEIWNEWNINAVGSAQPLIGAGGASDPRAGVNYAALATRATQTIKAQFPNSPVLVGAVGDDAGWLWTKDIVQRGVLTGTDGLSVHLYNFCQGGVSRTAGELIDRLTSLHDLLAGMNQGGTKVYVTEWGWPTGQGGCAVSSQFAAASMPQFLLESAGLDWIAGSWMYELKDQGADPLDIEQNFGLYDYNFVPKPQQCNVADAGQLIAGATAMSAVRVGGDIVLIKILTAQGLQVVAWSKSGAGGTVTVGGDVPFSARQLCQSSSAFTTVRKVTIGAIPTVIDVPGVSRLAVAVGA